MTSDRRLHKIDFDKHKPEELAEFLKCLETDPPQIYFVHIQMCP